jgi:biopolymer transport protein ExbB
MFERLSGFAFLGGASVLCLLFALSVGVVSKTRERLSFFRSRRVDLERLSSELLDRVRHGDFAGADRVLVRSTSLEATLVRPALDWIDGGPEAFDSFMTAERAHNRRELESTLSFLDVVGRKAPWIGLFGTIASLGSTFRWVAAEPARDATGRLLYGAWFALVPAAAGVALGVATTLAHHVLADEIAQIDNNVSVLATRVFGLLHFKKKLAQEFGMPSQGPVPTARGASTPARETRPASERPLSVTELD